MNSVKVLHLLSSTGYHGAENMAAELIHQLTETGVKNYLGVFYNNKNSNMDILKIVNPYLVDGVVFPCKGKMDIKTILLLRKYIRDNEIDIIHSHKYKTNFYSYIARLGTKSKLVSTCHNWLGYDFNMRFYAKLDKYILRNFNVVVGVSDEVVQELNNYVPAPKIRKIENGIDVQRYRRVMEKDEAKKALGLEGKQVIGFVGRLSPEKGISYLLQATYKLVSEGHDLSTIIVGDGDNLDALKAEVKSLGIEDRVVFTGKRDDTPLIYSALDVFVLPSLKEAFPMVILEAMACGVPIVATRVGDIPRIIESNVSGLIVEIRDVTALRQAIQYLLLDTKKADHLAITASKVVYDSYSSTFMANKYEAVYAQVIS